MGRKIITNGEDKWEIFSTITDSVIAEFNTKEGIKRFVAMERIYNSKLEAIQELICFPRGWVVNDERQLNENHEQFEAYDAWYKNILENETTYEDYYKAIDDKLEELLLLNPEEESD